MKYDIADHDGTKTYTTREEALFAILMNGANNEGLADVQIKWVDGNDETQWVSVEGPTAAVSQVVMALKLGKKG